MDFTSGNFVIDGTEYSLIDVPGAYSLKPLKKVDDATVVIILDTTRIERGL